MLTISKLGKRFGLSRATILYLESLNLDTVEIERIRRWSQANETG